ncbi:MAG: peptidylprolyl isomerase [Cytophagales bacterium]|nr:peptidylprolyl isomerase [Bernardetiaceae bacterium]MDW8211582.1 peptidylprolyl isomerase [Cytophagales bacterium]
MAARLIKVQPLAQCSWLAGSLLVCIWLTSCQSKGPSEQRTTAQPSKKEQKKAQIPAFPELNDQNVVQELTRYGMENPENEVEIQTRLGNIRLQLYEDTPLHRANFIRLAKMGYFDKTEFYRVIKGFMIQGGGSQRPSMYIGKYTIPAEINPKYLHVRGALAMAREYENNPQKRSASHDFYIVQGTRYTPAELEATARQHKFQLTAAQRATYAKLPGAPHLDGQHTVFGQVVSGMEVVDKIAALETDEGNWPLQEVPIKVVVIPKQKTKQ